jgi:hypothetical protein
MKTFASLASVESAGVTSAIQTLDPTDGATVRETAHAALSNLVVVLTLADEGRIKCSEKTKRPSAAAVATVAAALHGGDFHESAVDEPIAAFAWPLLVQAGGLANLSGTRLQPTARGRAVMAAPDYTALGALWTKWLAKAPIDEFSRIEAIKGQGKAATLTAATRRRAGVALGLATLPVGEWIAIDAVFRKLRRHPELTIARSERALWNLYLEDPRYGSMGYDGFGTWSVLEGRYALCVMFEYAATLGLLDVAHQDPEGARDDYHQCWGADDYGYLSRYDGLTAVRVNPLGATVLHDGPFADLGLPAVAPATGADRTRPGKPERTGSAAAARARPSRAATDRTIVAALADPDALAVFAAIVTAAAADRGESDRLGAVAHYALTETGLAKTTGLRPDAVTAATARLEAAGLVLEGGAPSPNWRLNRDAFTT